MFRPLMWPSSGRYEQEHKYTLQRVAIGPQLNKSYTFSPVRSTQSTVGLYFGIEH